MKKILLIILVFFMMIFTITSCNKNPDDTPSGGGGGSGDGGSEVYDAVGFTIHYNRKDSNYTNWGLWLWEDGKDGGLYEFEGTDSYGAYVTYEFSEWSEGLEESKLGFIVRKLDSWTKDYDSDRFIEFSKFTVNPSGYYDIYLKSGDKTMYTNAAGEVADIVEHFELSKPVNNFLVWFQLNKAYESYTLYYDNKVLVSSATQNTDINALITTEQKLQYNLGPEMPDITKEFKLVVKFKLSGKEQTVYADKSTLYKNAAFAEAYTYTGELGAIYESNKTTFRVWSPISSEMKVRIYETGTPKSANINGKKVTFTNGSDEYVEFSMKRIENGAWEYVYEGNHEGKYYTYVVTNSSYQNREVVDPYAKSTGINGYRGMIVDFSKTNPEGWENVVLHNIPSTSLTVYETHVADVTSHASWGGTDAYAKLFKGLYETGTSYTSGNVTVSTGFDHIKELGVNAVQLIPIYDQANDERPDNDPTRTDGSKRAFNWGYNPLNYNSLDGIYSTNPYDGYAKIIEFKELVKAYNEAGINIIMDVVYNHVSGLDGSNFDVLMPKYYFRYRSGVASNGSGCGNETASEMPMYRKFMIDSTEFWAKEYKLGGFRFDLMGVHDVKTMNDLTANLHNNVNKSITVYGEPWTGGTIALSGTAASQNNLNRFEGYGQFNDKMRDALIKGGLNSATAKGWVTNNSTVNSTDLTELMNGFKGITLTKETDPSKSINYVTCHDNYTLYDRIRASGTTNEVLVKRMAMLANSCVFTSQGISFMLAGEEMLRTKGGDSNSYESSYAVNAIDYTLKVKHMDMFNNYKALIALKQNANVFGKDATAIASDVSIEKNDNGSLIIMKVKDTLNKVEYIICHSNGVNGTKVVNLEGYTLYLDTLNQSTLKLTAETNVSPYQTIIAVKSYQ